MAELGSGVLLGGLHVETILQIEPELRGGTERLAQAQCSVGGDARRFGGNALDARARHAPS